MTVYKPLPPLISYETVQMFIVTVRMEHHSMQTLGYLSLSTTNPFSMYLEPNVTAELGSEPNKRSLYLLNELKLSRAAVLKQALSQWLSLTV